MTVTVSVIIPTYNRANMLKNAVESVLSQTYKDIEIIIVDDGSDDDTKSKMLSYPVRYIYQRHGGVSSARNRGIRIAAGKYIAFLDSDDFWMPEKISLQIKALTSHPECPLCHTNEIWVKDGIRINQKRHHRKHGGFIFDKILSICLISPSSALVKSEIFREVGLFDEELPVCEDYDMWLRICSKYPVHFIDKPLVVKRGGHEGQLSSQYWGIDRFRIKALQKLLKGNVTNQRFETMIRHEIVKKATIVANGALKRRKFLRYLRYKYIAHIYKYSSF